MVYIPDDFYFSGIACQCTYKDGHCTHTNSLARKIAIYFTNAPHNILSHHTSSYPHTSHHTAPHLTTCYLGVNDILQSVVLWLKGNSTGELLDQGRETRNAKSCVLHNTHTHAPQHVCMLPLQLVQEETQLTNLSRTTLTKVQDTHHSVTGQPRMQHKNTLLLVT